MKGMKRILLIACFVIVALVAYLAAGRLAIGVAQGSLGVLQYPTALDTGQSFFQVSNNTFGSLGRQVAPGDTTIYLSADASSFPSTGGAVTIGSEIIFYTTTSGITLTGCLRGQDGTVSQSHSPGEPVRLFIIAHSVNILNTGLEALEAKLGTGNSYPTGTNLLLMSNGAGASVWQAPTPTLLNSWYGFAPMPTSGGSFTGPVYLAADPTSGLQAVTKEYSDAHSGLTLFDGRTGAITLTSLDVTTALTYVPQTPLVFAGMLNDTAGTVSCETCEDRGNRNLALGYPQLTSSGLIQASQMAGVLSITQLTTYATLSGNGTAALGSTI